jgi:hypothetical protein
MAALLVATPRRPWLSTSMMSGVSLLGRADVPKRELLSGERFQTLADVSVMSRAAYTFQKHVERYAREIVIFEEDIGELDDATVARLRDARSLFLYTHDVEAFTQRLWPRLETTGRVLMTHNSDVEVGAPQAAWLDGAGTGVARWFAQNVTSRHPRLEPLPIGISNTMWPHGALGPLARAMRRQARRRRTEPIFAQFNASTHPSRGPALDALRTNFPQAISDGAPALPWRDYLELLGAHHFAACPRGNGLDTHRFWESQYLGVVPVVERTLLAEHWSAHGLPVVIVDDWSEVTPQRLRTEDERLAARTRDNRALRLSHYASLIAAVTSTA